MKKTFQSALIAAFAAAGILAGSNASAALVINEVNEGQTGFEFVELLVTVSGNYQNYMVVDSSGSGNVGQGGFLLSGAGYASLTAGTIIVLQTAITGTLDDTLNTAGGDWVLQFDADSLGTGTYAVTFDSGMTIGNGGDEAIWIGQGGPYAVPMTAAILAGTFGNAPFFKFGLSAGSPNSTHLATDIDLTNLNCAAIGGAFAAPTDYTISVASFTPGVSNGGANTTYIDALRVGGPVNAAPALVNRVVSPATATSANAITVSVDVTDSDGTISSVDLFRRVNGGGYTSTAMVLGAAPTYSLNLGTFADTDLVEYYIEATDDDSAIGTLGTSSSPFPLFVNNNRPAVGEIAITEIMFGPLTTAPYSQANAEFVEVRNLTGTPKNISYFLLDDSSVRNVAVPFGTIIAANGYVIFANPAATYTTYTPWTTSSGAAPVVNYTFGLGGTGDSFVVKNDASAVIDSVAYLNGTGGWPAVNDTGSSVILVGDPAVVDNTLPANWRASGLDGTPGAPNVDDITVPAVASIVRADANPTVATSVNFTVTFSEPVKNVGVADFAVNATGATGTIDAVSFVNPTTFTVSLSGVGGSGTLGLNIAGAQDVVDFPNNALSSTEPSTDESYNVGASSVAGWQLLND